MSRIHPHGFGVRPDAVAATRGNLGGAESSPGGDTHMYEIQLFGQLEVRTRGVRLSGRDFGGVKPRHILALLALRGALHKGELADLLWEAGPPANHVATLESYVSVLRRRLDPDAATRHSVIITRNGGYALDPERVRTDVARFDELLGAAAGRASVRALPPLLAAVQLAGRPLLDDEAGPGWAATIRENHRVRLVEALLCAGEHALAARQPRMAQELAARAVASEPFAERGWYVSMAAFRAVGDRVSALRAYDQCRRLLAEGLGVQPSPAVRGLFLELLREEGTGTGVDAAVAAVLAAARDLSAGAGWSDLSGGAVLRLLRRAMELAAPAPPDRPALPGRAAHGTRAPHVARPGHAERSVLAAGQVHAERPLLAERPVR
jgi:DNA-binding SARP family transcriptional activator